MNQILNIIISIVMMNQRISFITSVFLVTVLNIVLNKNSKSLKKEIQWHHYLFGYFFLLYLIILLKIVGIPSLSEWKMLLSLNEPLFNPHINLVPFKGGLDFTYILNIILFMPFGFLLPTLWGKFRKNLWTSFCYGLFFSFTLEIFQLFTSSRTTDIDDIITNVLGTICGWVIFNIMRKVFYKFANKTVVNICYSDTLAIKLEFYLYIVIAIVCTFCFCSI